MLLAFRAIISDRRDARGGQKFITDFAVNCLYIEVEKGFKVSLGNDATLSGILTLSN